MRNVEGTVGRDVNAADTIIGFSECIITVHTQPSPVGTRLLSERMYCCAERTIELIYARTISPKRKKKSF